MRIIGRGGMGMVWLARDEELGEEIALKFLPEAVLLDATSREELKRETRRSRRLAHPNIVKVYDFVSDGLAAAISMEFVDGDTLSGWRARQKEMFFEVREIEPWIKQMLDALIYAHEDAKIVHRDLKPANVMVNVSGRVKVTDFGIASSISETVNRVTVQRGSSGTLAYMSPQQMMGEAPSVRDDIYAFGATIYELLTGKPPFYRGDMLAQLQGVVPCSMAQRRGEFGIDGEPIPDEWEQTVAACLAKDRAQRPQNFPEVAEQLGLRVAPGTTPAPRPPSTAKFSLPEPPPPKPSGKGWLIGAGLAVAIVVLGGLGYYFGFIAPEEKARQAEIVKQNADAAAPQAAIQAKSDQGKTMQVEQDAGNAPENARLIAETQKADAQIKTEAAAAMLTGKSFENSLGMVFVPAGTDGVLFSIWDVRVKDFKAFVDATGYDATAGMVSIGANGWKPRGDTWKSPGFTQTEDDPVVGVSWNDAKAFCTWLTKKEQAEEKLAPNQEYRLPTDAEWSKAVGLNESSEGTPEDKNGRVKDVYPWGTQWPPPRGAGNYAGSEASNATWPTTYRTLDGYNDGYARTSPVGSFPSNGYGLYDMGGNVWQWCEDTYNKLSDLRVLRGTSWCGVPPFMISSNRFHAEPDGRAGDVGFRVVLAVSSPTSPAATPPAATGTVPAQPNAPSASQPGTAYAMPCTVTTLAGMAGYVGNNDGAGNMARFNGLNGLALDGSGNLYVADMNNNTIRKVTPDGVVSTLAGLAGNPGSSDGTGIAARFNKPDTMVLDGSGNIYVADSGNNTIRKITPGGVVSTLAGSADNKGCIDGIGGAARFNNPFGLAMDSSGTLYVSEWGNDTIRKITPDGTVLTVAGSPGHKGSSDGTGSAARFNTPVGVAVDNRGTLYVADTFNQTIRKITPDGVVSTLAGSAGQVGSMDGIGSAARFNRPCRPVLDSSGNLYVAEFLNCTVRKVTPGGVVTTLAGSAGVEGSNDGAGSAARFKNPCGLAMDSSGNLYLADSGNNTIRKITFGGAAPTTPIAPSETPTGAAPTTTTNSPAPSPVACTIILVAPLEAYGPDGELTDVSQSVIGQPYHFLRVENGKAVLRDQTGQIFKIRADAVSQTPAQPAAP